MLLAIDIGNTNTVLGLFDGDEAGALLADQDRRAHHRRRAGADVPRPAGRPRDHRDRGVLDRAGRAARAARRCSPRYYPDVPTVIVEPGVRTGVRVLTDNPKEVGADRIVNTAAAHHLVGGPAIVVDFGTSTNFDVVSAQRRVPRRRARPGHRDLPRRARRAGRPAAQGRAGRAAQPRSARTPSSRCSRASSTASPARSTAWSGGCAPRSRPDDPDVGRGDRHRRARPPGDRRTARRSTRYEPELTLLGLRLIYDRNARDHQHVGGSGWAGGPAGLHRAPAGRVLRRPAPRGQGGRGSRLRRVLPLRPLPARWAAAACRARPTPG